MSGYGTYADAVRRRVTGRVEEGDWVDGGLSVSSKLRAQSECYGQSMYAFDKTGWEMTG